jgi:hypothetical protein
MRIALALAGATALLLGAAGHAASEATKAPTLRLTKLAPVQVVGSGFAARERVSVTATLFDETARKTVRAGQRGGFSVAFDGLAADRCTPELTVRAFGARGSRASAKLPQLLCPPRGDPGRP